jgi:hypothetical protein
VFERIAIIEVHQYEKGSYLYSHILVAASIDKQYLTSAPLNFNAGENCLLTFIKKSEFKLIYNNLIDASIDNPLFF